MKPVSLQEANCIKHKYEIVLMGCQFDEINFNTAPPQITLPISIYLPSAGAHNAISDRRTGKLLFAVGSEYIFNAEYDTMPNSYMYSKLSNGYLGGEVVATGTPEEIAKNSDSLTAKSLKKYFEFYYKN